MLGAQAEQLRRLHRGGGMADPGALHPAGAAGRGGRLQRRPAHGRGAHPATRAVPGGGDPGAAARHASVPPVPASRGCGSRNTARPTIPEQFRWLRAYSPYHHVRPGRGYPAVLLATAESDTRVDPMHARKMTARLQAATSSEPAGAAPARGPGRPRGREAPDQSAGRAHRHLDVCVFGVGGRGLTEKRRWTPNRGAAADGLFAPPRRRACPTRTGGLPSSASSWVSTS